MPEIQDSELKKQTAEEFRHLIQNKRSQEFGIQVTENLGIWILGKMIPRIWRKFHVAGEGTLDAMLQ